MEQRSSLFSMAFKFLLFVILSLAVWVIPVAVVAVLNNGTQILRYGSNLNFVSIFEEIYEASPLPKLITKVMEKKSIEDLELGRLLFILLMGLPVSAILQQAVQLVSSVTGKAIGAVAKNGEYQAASWTGKVLTKVEASWYVVVAYLLDRFYGKQNIYLVYITIAILLIWFGFNLTKRFRGYSYIKSMLFDLLDAILELPVIGLLSACMLLVYSQLDTLPLVSAAMIGVMLLVEWLYSKATLFHSVVLFYTFRIGCFVACIYMSGYLLNAFGI